MSSFNILDEIPLAKMAQIKSDTNFRKNKETIFQQQSENFLNFSIICSKISSKCINKNYIFNIHIKIENSQFIVSIFSSGILVLYDITKNKIVACNNGHFLQVSTCLKKI